MNNKQTERKGKMKRLIAVCMLLICALPALATNWTSYPFTNNPPLWQTLLTGDSVSGTNYQVAWSNLLTLTAANAKTSITNVSTATNVLNSRTNFISTQFKMTGDGVRVLDATTTNTFPGLWSPSANFTSADVGKGCVIYLNYTNSTWIRTTVSSVTDAHHIILATNIPVTGTNTFVWGSDNTLQFSNAVWSIWTTGGGRMEIQDGVYCFWKDAVPSGDCRGSQAVIRFPSTFIRSPGNTNHISIDFVGASWAADKGISGTSNTPSMGGTIFYYAGSPTNSANYQEVFDGNTSIFDYAEEQYNFENITFRQPVNPQMWWFQWDFGGGLWFDQCAFDVEYPRGFQVGQNTMYIPTNTVQNYYTPGAVWYAEVNNDSNQGMAHTWVEYYGCGIRVSEHNRIDDDVIGFCGTGISFIGSQLGPTGNGTHILGCDYDLADEVPNTANQWVPLVFSSIEIEDYAYTTTVYDPSNFLIGSINFSAGYPVLVGGTNLQWTAIGDAGHPSPFERSDSGNSIFSSQGAIASEIGAQAINDSLVFDLPFGHRVVNSSGTQTTLYSRAPCGIVTGNINPANYTLVQSPEGLGIRLTNGNDVLFPSNTLCTLAVSFDMMFKATNIVNGVYLLNNGATTLNFQAYSQVGTFASAFRVDTTNGNYSAEYDLSNPGLQDGNWHEFGGTYDGTNVILYIDGTNAASHAASGALVTPVGFLQIGSGQYESIGHTRIWNRVLSPMEMYNLARSHGLGIIAGNGGGLTNTAGNGYVDKTVTNGLATTAYVNTATNGLATLSAVSATNAANLTATTNLVIAATNGTVAAVAQSGLPSGVVTNNYAQALNVYMLVVTNAGAQSVSITTNAITVITTNMFQPVYSILPTNATAFEYSLYPNGTVGYGGGNSARDVYSGRLSSGTMFIAGQTNGSGSANLVVNGTNYANVMMATNGLATFTSHIPTAITVGLSPWNFTNVANVAWDVWLTDGAGYTMSLNGQQIYGSLTGGANDDAVLQPGDYVTITYSSTTPTCKTNAF